VDSDPGLHGFWVSKEGGEAEVELLQIFSLDVAEGGLRIRQADSDYSLDLDSGGLR